MKCCSLGTVCEDSLCPEDQVYCNRTSSFAAPEPGCCPRPCSSNSFLCAGEHGSHCCENGYICAGNQLCVSKGPETSSATLTPTPSSAIPSQNTSQTSPKLLHLSLGLGLGLGIPIMTSLVGVAIFRYSGFRRKKTRLIKGNSLERFEKPELPGESSTNRDELEDTGFRELDAAGGTRELPDRPEGLPHELPAFDRRKELKDTGIRELDATDAPRELLGTLEGLLHEMPNSGKGNRSSADSLIR
ncbi:hypothetical protein GGS20DRAFT_346524 [Poronia punctata]|nr:hypothetical protein GGS20DRAFT_346524 [Poronia punctata]